MQTKVIVIVGPTSSGKSALSVLLAQKFNGEIISADSRQVYKGFNIGSGKITKREMKGVPHHLLDVASPKRTYTVARFKRNAECAIKRILKRGRMPIIVGGTGLYIDALLGNVQIPEVKPRGKLRRQLATKTTSELFAMLKKLDSRRASKIDRHNPRRLVRAIEIASTLGQVPRNDRSPGDLSFNILWVGLNLPPKELRKKIHIRLFARISQGMVAEVRNLHDKEKLSWKRLESFGLEYRSIAQYLQNKFSKQDPPSLKLRRTRMIRKLETEIWRYAKRQMRWFKRNKDIEWFTSKKMKLITGKISKFLTTDN